MDGFGQNEFENRENFIDDNSQLPMLMRSQDGKYAMQDYKVRTLSTNAVMETVTKFNGSVMDDIELNAHYF